MNWRMRHPAWGDYDEWYPDGEALGDLLDDAAELVPDVPDAVRELADHVIARTGRLLNYENCYGDGITEALQKAQDVHRAAREAGTPDPRILAERLASGALESGWGVFRDGPARQHGHDALWSSLHQAEKAHAADQYG